MRALCKRYPDLDFLLKMFEEEPIPLENDPRPLEKWLDTIALKEVELLYIVGLVNHPLPKKIESWLKKEPSRALVFIEKDLGAISSFREDALFENPKIHLFQSDEHLAETFPTDRLAIYVPSGREYDTLTLRRRSAALSALYSDVLYSHAIVRNVVANFRRLPSCFAANEWKDAFKNTPAIICGAGPSLEEALPTLRTLDDRALIFAGGSTITSLTSHGIQPHFSMALDPNREELDRLLQSRYFEGAYLIAPRLQKEVFATANGPFGYLKTDTGGLIENWLEEELGLGGAPIGPDLGAEAFSVTTLALSYAYAFGCNPIILAGVDLAFQEGKRYASGIEAKELDASDPRALEERLIKKNVSGKSVETLLKWVMEADAIASFAKEHSETTFYNASPDGLGFDGIETLPLEKIALPEKARDLRGEIHQKIQGAPLPLKQEAIETALVKLSHSLSRTKEEVHTLLEKKGGHRVVAELDLKEEPAYEALLSGIDCALDRILPRYYPSLDLEAQKERLHKAKYKEMLRQIELFQEIVD